jgi:uncharacterized protein (DUF1015 family)
MPSVAPFRGLEYALDRCGSPAVPARVRTDEDADPHPGRVADLTDLVCPPYDVITDAQRDALLAASDRNAVRLELSAEPDPHAAASATLGAWRTDGTLVRRDESAVYYYRHASPELPDELMVEAVVARVLLEPWGDGVRPHEHTMPGPKADRLALLHATRTQLSPILALYFDRSERYRHVMSRAWSDEWRARDADGLLHAVAPIEPDDRLLGYLARQTLYVADGHHRYETALAYQAEVRSDPDLARASLGALAADWIMVAIVNAELEQLEIRPTHRLIIDAAPEQLRSLASPGAPWKVQTMAPEDLLQALEARADDAAPAFGLVLPGGEGRLLVGDADAVAARMRREPLSTAVRGLDLAVLHALMLRDVLGIGPEEVAAGERLAYTRSATEAIERVAHREAAAAILVRPTRLEQLAAVASAGDVMPQKSTYFYPKLLTGMVFNPLED